MRAGRHTGRKEYARVIGSVCGWGGLKCSCCIPMPLPQYKIYMRRLKRHKENQELGRQKLNIDD